MLHVHVRMSIYYCTVSELQHFVAQLLILPILRVVQLHCSRTHNRRLFKMLGFHRPGHILCYRITLFTNVCDSEMCAFWPKKGNLWDFVYAWFYMGCDYPTIDINYMNYICSISVLFT